MTPRDDPDWCTGFHRAGGWGPIFPVIVFAVLTVAMTLVLVSRRTESPRRFLLLGVVVYLMIGLVSVTIGNASIGVSLGDMAADPLPHLLQLVLWPVMVPLYLSGDYGR